MSQKEHATWGTVLHGAQCGCRPGKQAMRASASNISGESQRDRLVKPGTSRALGVEVAIPVTVVGRW